MKTKEIVELLDNYDELVNLPNAKKELGKETPIKLKIGNLEYTEAKPEENDTNEHHPFFKGQHNQWHIALYNPKKGWHSIMLSMICETWETASALKHDVLKERLNNVWHPTYTIEIGIVPTDLDEKIQKTVIRVLYALQDDRYKVNSFKVDENERGAVIYAKGRYTEIEIIAAKLKEIETFEGQMFVQNYYVA